MVERLGGICAWLDESIPELREGCVHFTAKSDGVELCSKMSRYQARKMAEKVIRLLNTADREQRLKLVGKRIGEVGSHG